MKNETYDYLFIGSAATIIPLLFFSVNHPTMLGYTIVMIMVTITFGRIAKRITDDYNKNRTRHILKERERKLKN
jgi:predicted membrane channel-forming protein YqfA (hemolysin III family)